MDSTLARLLTIEEKLRKASDRIRGGKRISRNTAMNSDDALRVINNLMQQGGLSTEVKSALSQLKEHHEETAQKEKVAAMSANSKPIELGARGKADQEAKQDLRDKIAEHTAAHAPTQIKELGHGKQYQQDQQPAARPKTSGQMTGPVRERMATGEGITVADKGYGQALDMQRQLKDKEAKVRESKGPSAVIRVPGRLHEDDHVDALMKLKQSLPPEHHAEIDSDISNRLSEIGKKGA